MQALAKRVRGPPVLVRFRVTRPAGPAIPRWRLPHRGPRSPRGRAGRWRERRPGRGHASGASCRWPGVCNQPPRKNKGGKGGKGNRGGRPGGPRARSGDPARPAWPAGPSGSPTIRTSRTPGILFKDISPLLADHVAFAGAVDSIVSHYGRGTVDKVVGIEARGFILAAPAAYHSARGWCRCAKRASSRSEVHETAATTWSTAPTTLQLHTGRGGRGGPRAARRRRAGHWRHRGGHRPPGPRRLRSRGRGARGAAGADLFLAGRALLAEAEPDLDVHALLQRLTRRARRPGSYTGDSPPGLYRSEEPPVP